MKQIFYYKDKADQSSKERILEHYSIPTNSPKANGS